MTEPFIDNLVKTYSETKDPELLKPWKEPTKWDALQGGDRLLVADLFLLQGEKALNENRAEAEENFLIAKRIGEGDPTVLYKIAAFYAVNGDLQRAIESLKELLKTEPTYVDARSLLASSLSELSSLTDNIELSQEADREFRLIQEALKPTSLWNWAEALHRIALDSGEVSDYFAAVDVYRKAASKGLSQAIFFNSFANALVELAMLVERPQLFEEAVGYYKKVVELDPHQFEGYINLACTASRLWFDTGEESHFYSAHKAFEKASQYDKGDIVLWQKWGVLLFETGKAKQNEKLLRASLEKFSRADQLSPDHPTLLATWAEAELILGMIEERLDSLKMSESLTQRALAAEPDNPAHLGLLGEVYLELGRYFEENSYLEKAVDAFQRALSLDRTMYQAWYGLASSHHLLGRLEEDIERIQQAVSYYAKAAELSSELDPDFWNEWGVAMIKLGELTQDKRFVEGACEKFEQAIRLHYTQGGGVPPRADWLYNWGCCLDAIGDLVQDEKFYEKAIKVLSQAVQLEPDHYWAKFHLAISFAHLGESVSERELLERSTEIFRELAEEQPEDDITWHEWGVALMKLAEIVEDAAIQSESKAYIKEAKEKLEKAFQLGNELALYSMAAALAWERNFEVAMEFLERAFQRNALPPLEDILQDEWLNEMKETEAFQRFIERL